MAQSYDESTIIHTNNETNAIKVAVPGKLFLAGEYAVVSSGQAALLTTVDAFLHLTLVENPGKNGYLITNQADHPIAWSYDIHGQVSSDDVLAEEFPLIWQAMQTVMSYAEAVGAKSTTSADHFDLKITSDLDAADGTKYGLGSSGAISVAVVSALLKYYKLDQDITESQWVYLVFKLVAITQAQLGMVGSLGDVAASTQTGVIYYQNFDREWFAAQAKATGEDIRALIDAFWPELMIEQLPIDPQWTLSLIWSKEKASTEDLLKMVAHHISERELEEIMASFKQLAKRQVLMAKAAIQMNDWSLFKSAIKENLDNILNYTQTLNKPYLTKSFKKALKLVTSEKTVAKVSGAGAGDCAYAISSEADEAKAIQGLWRENDLVVLPFAFWQRNEQER
ncbi:phosphomevalonate kinase [Aerococcaceae bacterium 50-4]